MSQRATPQVYVQRSARRPRVRSHTYEPALLCRVRWRQDRMQGESFEDAPLRYVNCPLTTQATLLMCAVNLTGHIEELLCSTDESKVFCTQVCSASLDCSHASCNARCGECRALQARTGDVSKHKSHSHGKTLACGHLCKVRLQFLPNISLG